MQDRRFDFITRHAPQGISRRGSVGTLGGAALALLGGPAVAKARNNRNKKRKCRKKCRRQVSKTCRKQRAEYRRFVFDTCGNDPECERTSLPCGEPIGKCDTVGGIRCVIDLIAGA